MNILYTCNFYTEEKIYFLNEIMSSIRNLSAFRQLSLNSETSSLEQRRKSLKKQFSEDIPDHSERWPKPGLGIKVSFNNKSRHFINAPPIKIAWSEDTSSEIRTDDTVIIRKCTEMKGFPMGKLSRQSSLEKESIVHSKQELAERLKQVIKEKESTERPNIKIFLGHNSKDNVEESPSNQEQDVQYLEKPIEQPKIMPPLLANNVSNKNFHIRKNIRSKIDLTEITYSPSRTTNTNGRLIESNAVIVVPVVENEENESKVESAQENVTQTANEENKAINSVVIRPATAAAKRQIFQKRTNSAFNATVKETFVPRAPLTRSSSAPTKPEHSKSKFIISKRKVKTSKKIHHIKTRTKSDEEIEKFNEESSKNQKVLNRTTAVNGNEVVTMVSLVSPAGSDCEEENADQSAEKAKNAKNSKNVVKEEVVPPKMLSLRKTVKSVSFQQSSIHAIRSFSASFPARRASVASSLMLGNNAKSASTHAPKSQEKRSTNSSVPDDDECVPKRRLVRSNTVEAKRISYAKSGSAEENINNSTEEPSSSGISVDIKAKNVVNPEHIDGSKEANEEHKDVQDNSNLQSSDGTTNEEKNKDLKSPKEKQCWNLYCKMTEKGINVSLDTILRGMLTPTEYRESKKHFIEETEVLDSNENM